MTGLEAVLAAFVHMLVVAAPFAVVALVVFLLVTWPAARRLLGRDGQR